MKATQMKVSVWILMISILLSSCAPGQFLGPTLTPTLTPTLALTNTPTLTSTPEPTSTPTLTSTPEPTYTPIGTDVPLVNKVVRDVNFDDLSLEFELQGDYSLSNGVLKLEEPVVSGDPWGDGSVGLSSGFPVIQGNGYIILFRVTDPGTYFLVTFEVGPFGDPSHRSFWFDSGKRASIWVGPDQVISRTLNTEFKNDTWYYLLTRLYGNGVEIRLWEKDHPENAFSKTVDTGNEWVNNDFIFHVGLPEGVMEIDQFQEVQFSASESEPLVK